MENEEKQQKHFVENLWIQKRMQLNKRLIYADVGKNL